MSLYYVIYLHDLSDFARDEKGDPDAFATEAEAEERIAHLIEENLGSHNRSDYGIYHEQVVEKWETGRGPDYKE